MQTNVEYGSDGQSYCSSCVFYGLNKPCWKCRTYLPASELQTYSGQWCCPSCIMNMKDADRRASAVDSATKAKGERETEQERCQRCGRGMDVAYTLNNTRYCQTCADELKKGWDNKGGEKPPRVALREHAGTGVIHSTIVALEKKIGNAIKERIVSSKKIGEKNVEEGEKNKKDEGVILAQQEKNPISEGLAKTSGAKYAFANYKDLEVSTDMATKKKAKKVVKKKAGKKKR